MPSSLTLTLLAAAAIVIPLSPLAAAIVAGLAVVFELVVALFAPE